jgi:stearoyl-CoA desaturase (delta-9 desaturase)
MQNVIELKRSNKIQWFTLTAVVVFHALAVWALFHFSWQNLAVSFFLWWVSGSVGIGVGYHRLLTHKGFTVPKWLEYVLTVCGATALQAGPISWVATHRMHHAYTDTDRDPHSPRNGIFWSHMGWILKGTAQEHDEATRARYAPELVRDGFHRWIDKYYTLPIIVIAIALALIGGWPMVLWGVFLKTVWGWHSTWLVNSATHLWGSRRFDSKDDSRNNWLVAILAWGEGWHNNHHAHQVSAKHGLAWYEFDFNWIQIRTLEFFGLAKNIRVYTPKNEEAEVLQRAA